MARVISLVGRRRSRLPLGYFPSKFIPPETGSKGLRLHLGVYQLDMTHRQLISCSTTRPADLEVMCRSGRAATAQRHRENPGLPRFEGGTAVLLAINGHSPACSHLLPRVFFDASLLPSMDLSTAGLVGLLSIIRDGETAMAAGSVRIHWGRAACVFSTGYPESMVRAHQ